MPINDFTSKLLDLEDAIIENIETSYDTTVIHFSLQRKTVTCPFCPKYCHTTTRLAWHCINFLADKLSVKSVAIHNGVSSSLEE
ncbi:MAG: hypothetical protein ACFWTJ_00335 [Lachnoclostridium sp.]